MSENRAKTWVAGTLIALVALLLTSLAVGAPIASAAKLRSVDRLRVVEVGTGSIAMRWKDRSRGERSHQAQARPLDGGAWRKARSNGKRTRIVVRGLERGTAYESRVRACRANRCGPWGAAWPRTATLLAPFNGPHPATKCATFPAGDSFNRDVSGTDVDPRSDEIIDQINADGSDFLHPDFGSNPAYGIPFVVVPHDQPRVPIRYRAYGSESDKGPFPVPPGAPIEGGRRADGDRHTLVVRRPAEPGEDCKLFELYRAFETGGTRNGWAADSGSIFDLGSQLAGQRPDGWTSADAAGLPIYPGLVTYEEVQSGEIDHAIRITFEETRRGYLSPATHYASESCDPDRPPMGLRLRLKSSYGLGDISGDARVIATAFKRYGVIVADNGSNWFFSGSTDRRWNDENLNQLKEIPGSAFEVVERSGQTSPC